MPMVIKLSVLIFFLSFSLSSLKKLYDQKANVTDGKDDDWLDSWLQGFIDEHGFETVSSLLEEYLLKN